MYMYVVLCMFVEVHIDRSKLKSAKCIESSSSRTHSIVLHDKYTICKRGCVHCYVVLQAQVEYSTYVYLYV